MQFFNRFKTYFALYREFLSSSFTFALAFKLNFVLSIFVSLGFLATTIITINLFFFRFEHLVEWDENTFLFFAVFVLFILEIANTWLTYNYWELQKLIISGDLDFHLIRPVNPIFSVFLRVTRINTMPVLLLQLGLLIIYGLKIQLSVTAWLYFPIVVLLSFALLALIGTAQACLLFWVFQGQGINSLRLQLQNLACWPDRMFLTPFRSFFTYVFPLLAVGSAPVNFLLNPQDFSPLLILIGQILVFAIITRWLWRRGLLQYESASS